MKITSTPSSHTHASPTILKSSFISRTLIVHVSRTVPQFELLLWTLFVQVNIFSLKKNREVMYQFLLCSGRSLWPLVSPVGHAVPLTLLMYFFFFVINNPQRDTLKLSVLLSTTPYLRLYSCLFFSSFEMGSCYFV